MIDALEYIETPHVFRDPAGDILFGGTPDKVLVFQAATWPSNAAWNCVAISDYKFGRKPVPPAESNLQLRCYLTMQPAPEGYHPDPDQPFRPSNLLRRKFCPGSMNREAQIPTPPNDDDGGKYAEEGTMLHAHLADRSLSRSHLLPEQFETVEKAEAMEAEFLQIVRTNMKPGWGYGAIIQPRIASKPHIVEYSPEDLHASRLELIELWNAAHASDAPRRASEEACRYCRAVAICEEHKAWIMAIEKVAHLPAASWNPEQWNIFLSRRSALQKFIEERYEEAKAIKAVNPDAMPEWELKPGIERRVIIDIVGAWSRLSDMMSAKAFSDCCEASIGAIEKAIWESRQGTQQKLSQKEVKQIVNSTLDELIERRRNQPSLVREFPV